jgi:hypothetical protein
VQARLEYCNFPATSKVTGAYATFSQRLRDPTELEVTSDGTLDPREFIRSTTRGQGMSAMQIILSRLNVDARTTSLTP